MTSTTLPLYNFINGSFMIFIFALVCLGLIVAIFLFMTGGDKSKDEEESKNQ